MTVYARSGRKIRDSRILAPVAVLAASCLIALLAPGLSSAAFTRQPTCQIAGYSGGVAVGPTGELWVGEPQESKASGQPGPDDLYEFSSSCGSLRTEPLEIKGIDLLKNLAIERSSGDFYVTGYTPEARPGIVEVFDTSGKPVPGWQNKDSFQSGKIAIDNSTEALDPSLGSIYVTSAEGNLTKLNAKGEAVGFVNVKGEPVNFPYIKGNQITGIPGEVFHFQAPSAVAVGPEGDIYAVDNSGGSNFEISQIDEYRANGEFVRSFTGAETPGLGEGREYAWGGKIEGVAIDPVSDHLLVSVTKYGQIAGVLGLVPVEGAVDEFDAVSGHYLNQITRSSTGAPLQSAGELAVDAGGNLYVSDPGRHAVDVYAPGRFLATLATTPIEHAAKGTALTGSVEPEGLGVSECYFQYVAETGFKESGFASARKRECVPSAKTIPIDKGDHGVQAEIDEAELEKGVTYHYRLIVRTEGALGGEAASEPLAFTVPAAPAVGPASATNISSTFADLHAQINPLGAGTSYHFEYDTSEYMSSEKHGVSVPLPDASIGDGGPTGSAPESVLAHISGLTPETVYHFRVVATNEIGETDGPQATFTTLPAPRVGLADGRAYELVTPPDKAGGSDMFAKAPTNGVFSNNDVGYTAEDGNGFLLETNAAFGPFPASAGSAYVFSRSSSGWTYSSLASPGLGVQFIASTLADPGDLSHVAINDTSGSAAGESAIRGVNLLGPPAGPYTTLHTGAQEETSIVAGARDLSHVALESKSASLCPGSSALKSGEVICEWAGGYESVEGLSQPTLKLVDVNEEGQLLSRCGAALGDGADGGGAHGSVSADGTKIFFTAPDPRAKGDGGSCWREEEKAGKKLQFNAPQLYMRVGGETIEVSAPEAGVNDPDGPQPADYVGATEDGSKVFFLSEAELTKEAEELGLHDRELYEYDTDTAKLTRISAALAGSPNVASGAGVFTVPAVSSENGTVYFTALGRLTADAPVVGAGEVNLYRYDGSATTPLSYVASVSTEDYFKQQGGCAKAVFPDVGLCASEDWYTTPDGRYLLFNSTRDLSNYSTVGCSAPFILPGRESSNGHCYELYRYDASNGQIACVSCNPAGPSAALADADAQFNRSVDSSPAAAGPVRGMSDNGAYVFFDTNDALVPQDRNGTLDVYEWHEGHISLISSGADAAPSFFLGASADGSNVFFGTHAKLVPQDTDASGDIYDARICTGADPCIKPPSGETAQCEGDACHGSVAPSAEAPPVSLSFSGATNTLPEVSSPTKQKAKRPSLTEQLAKALALCRKRDRSHKSARAACEKRAKTNYRAKPKTRTKRTAKSLAKGGKS